MDVFGDIWDEEGKDELEGQQPVLETHNNDNKNRHVRGATVVHSMCGIYYSTRLREDGILLCRTPHRDQHHP